jgi:uncharacterized tellurite resistance protein B-like protein
MLESLLAKLRGVIDDIAPSPETLARREASALQKACCSLLIEVARLDSAGADEKRKAVSLALREQFALPDEDLAPMIANAGRAENRLTSYYGPVALINKRYVPEQKVLFIEGLWRVAIADGKIDMYEEQLVRKLADLLYVPHTDFILAKHRVQNGSEAPAQARVAW